MKKILVFLLVAVLIGCESQSEKPKKEKAEAPFLWESANLYFLLTDRFNNGDTSNDLNFDRTKEAGKLRGFEGGDIKGITQKINDGYFTDLGINAIWMTPIVEQIHDGTDEGTGLSYGFHGYWASDWTAIDPNFGTKEDLKALVDAAHEKGIRVLLDAVINHTGPVTDSDPVWPSDWVRTEPQCKYDNYERTITCTLVKNLPDIRTDSNEEVELPPQLVAKWKEEGRYEQEVKELDEFFKRTGHPRAPRFYIMKWLADYITEFGIDGYRVDTVKHTEEFVWEEFKDVCDDAFEQYKSDNPDKVLDDTDFYLVGEVYGYGISGGQFYDFGDKKVNYFDDAFNSLINFDFKWNSKQMQIEELFSRYSNTLNTTLDGYGVLNYLSSHDDGQPFDPERVNAINAGTLLLLAPGTSQTYYGDETARSLKVEGAVGDATLRSVMNWDELASNENSKETLAHYQKLGKFRIQHPSIGAGTHQKISDAPYTFSRVYQNGDYKDEVVIALNAGKGEKTIEVAGIFEDGDMVRDAYSGVEAKVADGKVSLNTDYPIVLIDRH
jgi:alpha-amylase